MLRIEGQPGKGGPGELGETDAHQSEGVELQSEHDANYRVGEIFASEMLQLRSEGRFPDYDQSIHGNWELYAHKYGPLVTQALEEARRKLGLPSLEELGPMSDEELQQIDELCLNVNNVTGSD